MGPAWGPSGPCRPQTGPMLAPWNLFSGVSSDTIYSQQYSAVLDGFKALSISMYHKVCVAHHSLQSLGNILEHIRACGGVTKPILRSVIFPIFHHRQNTSYLLNITFIFDRCHCSSGALMPVKYENAPKILTGISHDENTIKGKIDERKVSYSHPWTKWQTFRSRHTISRKLSLV